MISVTVNGKVVELEPGFTILQACEMAGFEIPRFCYHERLSIAGNCRMCLVEVQGGPPKPVASCAMNVADGMVINTNTPMVEKARKGVMEFLLINHPLDCPICDQGGECDLQDQAMAYGCGNSRFVENKRSVPKKHFGPLIETAMNRCIHCTRCVRFLSDVAGVKQLGTIGRGEDMEISTYIKSALNSELSGNIIDLCPVGALTSKPYSFTARSWELFHTETIDVLDAVGSAIRVDTRGQKVMRVLPRLNEDINEEWISDKARFSYDGLALQRLDRPYIRSNGKLIPTKWETAFDLIKGHIQNKKIASIVGDLADCEAMLLLKEFTLATGSDTLVCGQRGEKFHTKHRAHYLFNTTIAGIEKADLCLLVGTNPRFEAPLINARIRKAYLENNLQVVSMGSNANYNYPTLHFNGAEKTLEEILDGKHQLCDILSNAQNPMVIVGQDVLLMEGSEVIMGKVGKIVDKYNFVHDGWNGFNFLQQAASTVGALDIGYHSSINDINEVDMVYLLGADEIDFDLVKDKFVIYQGHHGDKGAHYADVILPGAAYTEKDAIYVNTEGRAQYAYKAINPPGEAYDDWRIIRDLASHIGYNLQHETITSVRERLSSIKANFANINDVISEKWQTIIADGESSSNVISSCARNFYMTDPISRASKIMAQCSKELWNIL